MAYSEKTSSRRVLKEAAAVTGVSVGFSVGRAMGVAEPEDVFCPDRFCPELHPQNRKGNVRKKSVTNRTGKEKKCRW